MLIKCHCIYNENMLNGKSMALSKTALLKQSSKFVYNNVIELKTKNRW